MKKLLLITVIFLFASCYAEVGNVIFLNGSSSSGKSTIAAELVRKHPNYKVISIDDVTIKLLRQYFRKRVPEAEKTLFNYIDDGQIIRFFTFINRKKRSQFLEEQIKDPAKLKEARKAASKIGKIYKRKLVRILLKVWGEGKKELIRETKRLALEGHTVIVDDILMTLNHLKNFDKELKNIPTLLVGLKAPLKVVEERERKRGDRDVGTAHYVYKLAHAHRCYDLVIDTSVTSPKDCAKAILKAVNLQAKEKMQGVINDGTLRKIANQFKMKTKYATLLFRTYTRMFSRIVTSKMQRS